MSKSSDVTRRSFVQGAALGIAAGGLAAGSMAHASEKASSAAAGSSKAADAGWDAEYDVVVLGLGGAGANAAVAAYEEGAKVLVCEKAPEGEEPCNTKASGQFVMATDDADQLYSYLSQLMGKFNNWDEDALRGYCEGAAENFAWMTGPMGGDPEVIYPEKNPADDESLPFEYQNPSWKLDTNDMWGLGREGYYYNWDEFPEIPESAHCLCLTATGTRFDAGYYNLCMNAVNTRVDGDKLTVWRGCPGKKLVTDDSGAVTGVVVEKDGEELRIRAKGGVCLCTGGLEANADMMANYTQTPYVYLQAGTMNTGDGIRMAQEVGAQLWHMSNVSGFMWAYQSPYLTTCKSLALGFKPLGVYVGPSGARFQNETAYNRHGRINIGGRWIMTPLPLPCYYVVDANAEAQGPLMTIFSQDNSSELADGQIITGETIDELSQNIRAAGDAPDFNANGELDAALAKYNAHCHANGDQGEEDDWGRMCTVPVETGPFYAVKLGPTMYNTQGGPRRNGKAQVIGIDNLPIEGLFEGGEMGSVFADMYNGSGNLGETMVFGRLAGRNAALRAQGKFQGDDQPVQTYQEKLDAQAASAKADEASLSGTYADGTYEGHGQGYGGPLTLSVTVEGGKISSVEVVSDSETATIGKLALPDYCSEVTQVSSLDDIDVSSGASNTLRGFKTAIQDALSQASA
ncbi:MAG: FAD-binding protein [Coriobacteriales bacterium]|jgi:succinate dehydrogenase/fumarate reductase flavoprotein subunit